MAIFKARAYSPSLRRQVKFNVCLPTDEIELPGIPTYEQKDNFKTIYLLHGHGGNEDDWLYGANIDMLSMKYNVAVVMPSIENSFYLDDPNREAFYARFVGEELVDYTHRVFPLSNRRGDTVIGGLSMGGYGALRTGLYYHETFGSILAFSSALITDDVSILAPGQSNDIAGYAYYRHVFGPLDALRGSDKDPKALAEQLLADGAELPGIYMACGTEDFLLEENRDYHRHLEHLGIAHTYEEAPGEHDWAFWDIFIDKALAWYAGSAG